MYKSKFSNTVQWGTCKHPCVSQDVFLSTGQKHLATLEVGAGTRNSCLPEHSKRQDYDKEKAV